MLAVHSLIGTGPKLWAVELTSMLKSVIPSIDQLQITNTGGEAVALAIHLSRAHW